MSDEQALLGFKLLHACKRGIWGAHQHACFSLAHTRSSAGSTTADKAPMHLPHSPKHAGMLYSFAQHASPESGHAHATPMQASRHAPRFPTPRRLKSDFDNSTYYRLGRIMNMPASAASMESCTRICWWSMCIETGARLCMCMCANACSPTWANLRQARRSFLLFPSCMCCWQW